MDPKVVATVCERFGNDSGRLLDVLRAVHAERGHVDDATAREIARRLSVPFVDVRGVISFYAFFSSAPRGRTVIRLCNDVIDRLRGAERVGRAFEEELGIRFGETTADGAFSLEWTPCIGMSDQAPAALVGDVVLTRLSSDRAREIVRELRAHGDPRKLVRTLGDGNNAHPLVRSMVVNHLRQKGPVIFDGLQPGAALRQALSVSPMEVIRAVKAARLRGRGGAGFPTGMKWEFTRQAAGRRRFVVCNADEGEPGTFKDRVVLTERPDLLFEGMTIAGYAVGASEGLVYLRAEYAYLKAFLEDVLRRRREAGLLGHDICDRPGFDFDIRIRLGAGAYICGEESALLDSLQGQRGDPRNRPPFPAQSGYLGCPTTVNNVETLCCVARILERGAAWFADQGSLRSTGTKLFSVSGDCQRPGVYELPFGVKVRELLTLAGADEAIAVQVGGPSGKMIGPDSFERTLCYDDLASGGSIMVFGPGTDLLEVVQDFLAFFIDESCGYCTPCRVGNVLLAERLARLRRGLAGPADIAYLEQLGRSVKAASRCGLGQTSPNPILSTLEAFPDLYQQKVTNEDDGDLLPTFDIQGALEPSRRLTGRDSVHFPRAGEEKAQ
ncbi:MAG: NAD(P)H-dependent oxidoreductase subunit E [Acidobacteriota bacterium]|nr:NAD(P)H-dependent oxidoreductase subunit E [Acidobacteriota bacterium]